MTTVVVTEQQSSVIVTDNGTTTVVATAPAATTVEVSTTGPSGPAGAGVPVGGDMGDIIIKNTAANYDTSWVPTLDGGTFN